MPDGGAPLGLDDFCRRFGGSSDDRHALSKLHPLLASLAAEAPLAARIEAVERLSHWVRFGGRVTSQPGTSGEDPRTSRLRVLVTVLDKTPAWQKAVATNVSAVLAETSGVRLFCQTG